MGQTFEKHFPIEQAGFWNPSDGYSRPIALKRAGPGFCYSSTCNLRRAWGCLAEAVVNVVIGSEKSRWNTLFLLSYICGIFESSSPHRPVDQSWDFTRIFRLSLRHRPGCFRSS
jgi:hypothetical protein